MTQGIYQQLKKKDNPPREACTPSHSPVKNTSPHYRPQWVTFNLFYLLLNSPRWRLPTEKQANPNKQVEAVSISQERGSAVGNSFSRVNLVLQPGQAKRIHPLRTRHSREIKLFPCGDKWGVQPYGLRVG